jgi:hypothetical protein
MTFPVLHPTTAPPTELVARLTPALSAASLTGAVQLPPAVRLAVSTGPDCVRALQTAIAFPAPSMPMTG